MSVRTLNALILCTGNSARSVLGEAILNRLGGERIRAFSAGSQPTGKVNPLALALLERRGYDTASLRSKSWDEFATPDAPPIRFVLTVCDSAARETCPVWPGAPVTAHWGLPDPAAATGSDADKRAAFESAYEVLEQRIAAFVELPFESLDGPELEARLAEIGRIAAAGA